MAAAEVDEDEGVNYDCGKYTDENPEVVEPETFDAIGFIDPAL